MELPAVLALNCGSSTVKFAAFIAEGETRICSGIAEALGTPQATFRFAANGESKEKRIPGADHRAGIDELTAILAGLSIAIVAVGHRVVHGGESFAGPALIDDMALAQIEKLIPLAPLHNPHNAAGIRLMQEHYPDVPQVAVFDTAFHQTLPPHAFHYGLPLAFHERHRVRRYGFHGTSHQFVAREAARRLERELNDLQLVTVHLGNGCSACAIKNGRSVDTTMGLTPSEGLMMGTRSGDVDPLLHQYLAANAGMSLDQISHLLIREGGLLGVSGTSNDRRQLEQLAAEGDSRARLALTMFCFRAAKGILGMAASLDRLDALVFTGGIGENSAAIRQQITNHLPLLNIHLSQPENERHGAQTYGRISTLEGPHVCVIPTNEELTIAREVWRLI